MFIEHANLLKKLRFPRILLTSRGWVLMLAKFYPLFFRCSPFFSVNQAASFPVRPTWHCFRAGCLVAFSTGLGMVLGVLKVFFRGCRPGLRYPLSRSVLADADRLFLPHLAAGGRVIDGVQVPLAASLARFRVCW